MLWSGLTVRLQQRMVKKQVIFPAMVLASVVWPQAPGVAGTAELSNAPAAASAAAASDQKATDDLLRSFLRVQDQLHTLQLSIDNTRQEAAVAAARDSNVLSGRLQAIERSLAEQRERELQAVQNSNRVVLMVAGAVVGVGFLAMIFTAWFQWRTINRLAELSSLVPSGQLLGTGDLRVGDRRLLSGPAWESNQRLLGNLDRLEKRILELEQTAQGIAAEGPPGQGAAEEENATRHSNRGGEDPSKANVLLAKGQSLLAMEKAEEALATFNEALQCEPQNTEVLLKKAAALERLGNLQDALGVYDAAIAADPSLTLAYLQKGGVLNRLERFEDALGCYEAALRSKGG